MEDVVDEEQYKLASSLKAAKRGYRDVYRRIREAQLGMQSRSRDVVEAKMELFRRFNEWFAQARADETLTLRAAGLGGADEEELLDASEQFDRVEMQRIILEDPDSVSFHTAKKSLKKMTPVSSRTLRGEKAKASISRKMEREVALNFGYKSTR